MTPNPDWGDSSSGSMFVDGEEYDVSNLLSPPPAARRIASTNIFDLGSSEENKIGSCHKIHQSRKSVRHEAGRTDRREESFPSSSSSSEFRIKKGEPNPLSDYSETRLHTPPTSARKERETISLLSPFLPNRFTDRKARKLFDKLLRQRAEDVPSPRSPKRATLRGGLKLMSPIPPPEVSPVPPINMNAIRSFKQGSRLISSQPLPPAPLPLDHHDFGAVLKVSQQPHFDKSYHALKPSQSKNTNSTHHAKSSRIGECQSRSDFTPSWRKGADEAEHLSNYRPPRRTSIEVDGGLQPLSGRNASHLSKSSSESMLSDKSSSHHSRSSLRRNSSGRRRIPYIFSSRELVDETKCLSNRRSPRRTSIEVGLLQPLSDRNSLHNSNTSSDQMLSERSSSHHSRSSRSRREKSGGESGSRNDFTPSSRKGADEAKYPRRTSIEVDGGLQPLSSRNASHLSKSSSESMLSDKSSSHHSRSSLRRNSSGRRRIPYISSSRELVDETKCLSNYRSPRRTSIEVGLLQPLSDRNSSHHSNTSSDLMLSDRSSSHHSRSSRRETSGRGRSPPRSSSDSERRRSSPPPSATTIEVAPGIYEPLRGSQETLQAASLGKICMVSCFCCSHSLHCIADAKYVICPSCRVIGPAGGDGGNNDKKNFGVGLGFCAKDLPRNGESSSSRRQVVPLVTG